MFGLGDKGSQAKSYARKDNPEKLAKLLSDKDPAVRIKVCEALSEVESDCSSNALIFALKDENPTVRVAAAKALAKVGKGNATEHIRHIVPSEKDTAAHDAMKEAVASIQARLK